MRKLLVVLLFVSAPLFAQDRNIHLTIWASQVDMEGDTDLGDFEADFDEGNALGVSANYGINRWFSVEGSVFGIRSDATLGFEDASLDLGSVDLVPFTLGAQVHLLGDSRFDPYIGAGAAYVVADDLSSSDLDTLGLGRIELENQATYYLNAGVGIRIAGGFGITVDGRQIQYEPSSRSTTTGVEQDLDLSPRLLSVGLRLRF
ncbi:MAG TPA: OmpW family outer membrane protein [Thermoanaerobaculia bacterium]